MTAPLPTSSSTFELAPSASPHLSFDDHDGQAHTTPTQIHETAFFTPHNGRPLSVFDNARLDGKRAWASVDCGPGSQHTSPHGGSPLTRAGGSTGTVDGFYSPESEYGGGGGGGHYIAGYAASPGMSSVLEQMSLGAQAHPSPAVVFDNPSPFEAPLHVSPHSQQQVYISPNQPFQPLPHGTPSRESYYPHHQDPRHLETPSQYHLSNSSSMSSMSSSNDLSTPPNAPYQVLGPDGYVYASTPVRSQDASQGQLQSPYYPQHASLAHRPMTKRSRSSMSSSPHEYDDELQLLDGDRPAYYDTRHGDPNPSASALSYLHDGQVVGHPAGTAYSDGRPEKKNRWTNDPPALLCPLRWAANGSELPDELRGWTPEMMQEEWKMLRGSDYRPATSRKKPFAMTAAQEVAFLMACYYLPVLGRVRILFFGRLCGRNEIIATFVNLAEGEPAYYRSKKRISSMFGNLKKPAVRVPTCINMLVNRTPDPEMALQEQSGRYRMGVFHHVHPALYDLLGLPVGTDLATAERPAWLADLDREVDEAERLTEEAKQHRKRTKGNLEMEPLADDDGHDSDYAPPRRNVVTRPSPLRSQSYSSSPVQTGFTSPSTRPEFARRSISSGAIQFTPRRTSYSPKHPSPLQDGDHELLRRESMDVRMDPHVSGTPTSSSALGFMIPAVVPVGCAFYATEPLAPENARLLASVPAGWNPSSIGMDTIHFDDIHIVRDRYPNLRQLAARSHAPALHIQIALDLPSIEEAPAGSMYLSAQLDLSCAWGQDVPAVSVVSSSVDDGPVMASSSALGEPVSADGSQQMSRPIQLPVGFISSVLEQTCGARSENIVVYDISRPVAPLYVPSTEEIREGLRADVLPALAVLQEIVSRTPTMGLLADDEVCPISEGGKVGDAVHLVVVYSFSLAEPGEGGVRIQTIAFDRPVGRSKSKSPSLDTITGGTPMIPATPAGPSVCFSPASPKSAAKVAMAPPTTTRRTRAASARNKANLSITLPPSSRLEAIPASAGAEGTGDGPIPFTPLDKINMTVPSAPPPINLQSLQPRRLFGSADMASVGPYSGGGVAGSLQPASHQFHHQQRQLGSVNNRSQSFDASPLPSPGIFAVGNQARQRMAGWTESQPSPAIGSAHESSMDGFDPHLAGEELGRVDHSFGLHSPFPAASLGGHPSDVQQGAHEGVVSSPHQTGSGEGSFAGAFFDAQHDEHSPEAVGHDFDGSDMFDFASFSADRGDWLDQSFDSQHGSLELDAGERMDEGQLLF